MPIPSHHDAASLRDMPRIALIGAAVGLVILGLAIGAGFRWVSSLSSWPSATEVATGTPEAVEQQSPTRAPVPKNVSVPDAGVEAPEGVAVPKTVGEAAPGVLARERTFEIVASGGRFEPATVIVRAGDTVRITFRAEDKTYDITVPDYGLKQVAEKGETKLLLFQATNTGDFTFYCDLCGGLKSNAVGHLIVTEK